MEKNEFIVKLRINDDGNAEIIDKVKEQLDDVNEKTANLEKTSKKSDSAFKKLADGIKSIGKTTGVIALVAAAFNTIKSVISSTQEATDFFSAAFGTFTDIIKDAFNFILDNAGKIIDYFKGIFENPVQSLKDFGNAIKENLIERFNSFLDTLGYLAEGVKNLFTGEFSAALDSFGKAGKESIDILTGVNNTVDNVTEAVIQGAQSFSDYVSEIYKSNVQLVNLQNNAKLTAALSAKLSAQYEREAEIQRQLRDDTSESITKRIEANAKLSTIIDKQEEIELKGAKAQLAAAQATLSHSKTIENQVAVTEALTAVEEVKAKATSQRSEQLINQIALNKELNELIKTEAQSKTDLAITSAKFAADSNKNEIDRLKAQRDVLEQEKSIQLERLQNQIDSYKEGTQDRLNAEIAYAQKKQELEQSLQNNAIAISDAETLRNNEINILRAQNDLSGFEERRALLELEYSEKIRLAYNDKDKIIEIEKEKAEKIRQLNLELNMKRLQMASDVIGAIAGLDEAFSKNNKKGARAAFNRNKAYGIAQAGIQTGLAVTAALTAGGNALKIAGGVQFIEAGIAAATGIAQIAKIASTKFNENGGDGGGGGSTSVPSVGGGGGGSQPSVPAFNALNLGLLQNRPDQTPKAYVLAQDVSSAVEARDKVRDLARIN
jgi:hypothetical protein